ncbi:hypothetical protein [Deinococcus cellulosilyticus]|uniref:Uncharacterized protein n=1 Tax=Deinococcus cellulosilyticus (strain DSM 18568 / NBRC 106333 / KACC 11606 / 5516J-15) TaxID=1223518 RepID=A0A511N5X9_DEIC1|nr:hypothetical protein [Deinococcus cellulosilyticus]GEM47811.1 hypothetical protein DC3_34460 [Deinococcus cellulosilyticus NBRC 106333 = KACC 11606]
MPVLKWIGRKVLALIGAALVVAVAFAVMELWDGSSLLFSHTVEGLITAGFFALYIGSLPALVTTGLSDAISPAFGNARRTSALVIHLLGGFLVMFALLGFRPRLSSDDWFFVGLSMGAALVFFLIDERLRPRLQPR